MVDKNLKLSDLTGSQKTSDGLNEFKQDSNVFLQAITNVPSSAKKFAKDVITPFLSPIQTAKDLASLGSSVVNLIRPGEQGNEEIAKQVGNFFVQRYGSLENIKKTFATDPVGMLSDVSIILTGGAALAPKGGQVASIASKAAKVTDPIKIGSKGASLAGELPTQFFGATTGAGGRAIKEAIEAGAEGGTRQKKFKEGMRGEDLEGVVRDAYESIRKINQAKSKSYRDGISGLQLGKKDINFSKVDQIIKDYKVSKKIGSKGRLRLNKESNAKLKEIESLVDKYRNDTTLHNVEGLDFLKQEIDGLYPTGINPGQVETVVAEIRRKVYDLIIKEVPDYAKVMDAYETASKAEKAIIKELSMGKNVGTGTTLRKLNQAVKDNAASNFGNRADMVANLNPNIMPKLAGGALSSYVPRGLQGVIAGGGQVPAMAYAVSQGANPAAFIPGLLAQSPRLVGNMANIYGMAKGRNLPFTNTPIRQLPLSATSKVSRPLGLLSNEMQNNEALQNRGLLQ